MNAIVQVKMAGTVARQKDNESDEVSWGEFLWVAIICEYNVAYYWLFSGIDAHPPHAINRTNISAHICNPSEQLCFKKASNLAVNSLVRNPPRAGKAYRIRDITIAQNTTSSCLAGRPRSGIVSPSWSR